ncbi:MAG: hypothetical protein KKE84_10175 [Gammaproteobacteria bacterium]|nr:hypothetical protein [Gammaproteobacteria bacterium]
MAERTQTGIAASTARPCQPSRGGAAAAGSPFRCAVAVLALLVAGGCSHTLVHNENRDKQGQETKKLAAEARIGDTVAALEKSFSEAAALEEARARDRAAYLFDLELKVVSRASSLTSKFTANAQETDGLQTVVTDRLAKIGLTGNSPDELRKLRVLAAQFTARQRALETTLLEFRGTVGHRFESCMQVYAAASDPAKKSEVIAESFLNKLPADRRELARLKYPALIDDCKRIEQALDKRNKFFTREGLVKETYGRLDSIQGEVLRYELQMRQAREELNKAAAVLRDSGAVAAAKPAATGKLETVESRAGRLADVVHRLAKGSDALGDAGAHVVAAEKLARLEALLGAIAGTSPDGSVKLTPDEQVSVAIIRDIPALADEADKLLKEAGKPRLVPFVAAIDQQKLVLQGFEAGQRGKRKEASAVRSELEAVLNEARALVNILEPLVRNKDWAQRSIGALLGELNGEKKIELLRALAVYADDVKRYRVKSAVWKVRAEAAQYEEGLARSKYAAAQWDALIDTIATVLADYHAAGIKKADLAEFFKALGLVAIGVGAAQ